MAASESNSHETADRALAELKTVFQDLGDVATEKQHFTFIAWGFLSADKQNYYKDGKKMSTTEALAKLYEDKAEVDREAADITMRELKESLTEASVQSTEAHSVPKEPLMRPSSNLPKDRKRKNTEDINNSFKKSRNRRSLDNENNTAFETLYEAWEETERNSVEEADAMEKAIDFVEKRPAWSYNGTDTEASNLYYQIKADLQELAEQEELNSAFNKSD